MDTIDIRPRHGEVEYWQEMAIDLKVENARLREALEQIVYHADFTAPEKMLRLAEDALKKC